ncbi:MAG: dethiobiotin synthase [Planctomycetia bacterium]
MARGMFVTGTDTDVGKTAVAVALVRQLVAAGRRVGVYKPVATGAADDACALWEAAGRPLTLAHVCPQVFSLPIAPPRSARAAGTPVDDRLLEQGIAPWIGGFDVVIVEGAGGLCSPLSDTASNADLARRLDLPVVLVDAARLGAIGRTLMAVTAARSLGLTVAAVVLSQTVPLDDAEHDDPASPWRIAHDSRADLATALAPLPVAMLAHGGLVIDPPFDVVR